MIDWEDSKVYDFPEGIELLDTAEQVRLNELKAQAEAQRRVTGDMWRKAVAATRRPPRWRLPTMSSKSAGQSSITSIGSLRKSMTGTRCPAFRRLEKLSIASTPRSRSFLEEKRAEEPDEVEAAEGEAGVNEDGTPRAAGAAGISGPIQSRRDALRRLGEIADFFQKTEPHSPHILYRHACREVGQYAA